MKTSNKKINNVENGHIYVAHLIKMILPRKKGEDYDCPYEMDVLDPRVTAVVYNSGFGKRPVMSICKSIDDDNKITYAIYTPTEYFEIQDEQIKIRTSHILKNIPVVEYPANTSRLGSFETVLGLLDAINSANSNRIDGIEQFVQSYMKFVNVKNYNRPTC